MFRRSFAVQLCAALAGALSCGAFAYADADALHAGGPAEAIHVKRAAASAALAAAERAQKDDDATPDAAADKSLTLLRSLESAYLQHESLLEEEARLTAQSKQEEKDLARLKEFGPTEPKPYSFLLLEKLRNELADDEDRQQTIKADAKAAKQLLTANRKRLDAAEQRKRGSSESKHKSTTPSAAGNPASAGLAAKSSSELEIALAAARVDAAETAVQMQTQRLEVSQARQKRWQEAIEWVEKEAKFTAADRDRELERLTALSTDLDQQRSDEAARWHDAATADGELATDAAGKHDDAAAPRRAAREISTAHLLLLDQERELLTSLRKLWKHRYELAQGSATATQPAQWLDDVDESLEELHDWQHTWEQRLTTLSQVTPAVAVSKDGDKNTSDESDDAWEKFRADGLARLRAAFDAGSREVHQAELWLGRFRTDLKGAVAKQNHLAGLPQWLQWGWDYEVLHDEKSPFTLGKLLVLCSYILAGLILAWIASWLIGRRLLPRLGWHPGRIAALKSILFYSLFLLFGFAAFKVIQIPTGAFAFLGGVAAIALGFGSQDIMNNFMSGIILLVEQPIRVGDIIELGETQGKVVYIGLRSTRLLTEANHELIVANKTLLDEQVTNLTLSDAFVRNVVMIDVDRTRPVFATKRRMMELAFAHPLVTKSPRPVVLLTEVDTYALRFQVQFWMEHSSFLRCAVVQSEILESITAEFPPLDESSEPAAEESEPTATELEATAPEATESEATAPETAEQTASEAAEGDSLVETAAAASGAAKPLVVRPATGREDKQLTATIRKLSRAAIQREIKRSLRD